MTLHRDEIAVSAVVATILIGAMTTALAAVVLVWVHPERKVAGGSLDPRAAPANAGGYADFGTDYWLTQTGPDLVPLAHGSMIVVVDNVSHNVPLSALAPQLPAGATQWVVGQRVCIAGSAAGCLYPPGQRVAVTLVVDGQQVFKLPALPASPPGALP